MTDPRVKKERKKERKKGNLLRDSWWSLPLIDFKLKSKERLPDKTLYKIGIIDISDKAQNKVKIHYEG